jgi:D-alanyl-D-alanine carboxypeptidase
MRTVKGLLSLGLSVVILMSIGCVPPEDVQTIVPPETEVSVTGGVTAESEPSDAADITTDAATNALVHTEQTPEYNNGLWALWLINAKNPLPDGYLPDLVSIGSYNGDNRELDSRAAPYAIRMMQAAANDGISLVPVSAYRRITTQENNFRAAFNELVNQGLPREQAFEETASVYAVPGTSEHNAGVAIDFNSLSESFDQTDAFNWLISRAHEFGFIARYPKGTTHITGIIYEPWHWRFVGVEHAVNIREARVTLEEYIGGCRNDDSAVTAWKIQLGVNYD